MRVALIGDLTPLAFVDVFKSEHYTPPELCDVLWDKLDVSIQNNKYSLNIFILFVRLSILHGCRVIGCYRAIKDAYGETVEDRKGISLGMSVFLVICTQVIICQMCTDYMYQVVTVIIATAEATETLNALTVGMVGVRNLQIPATGAMSGASSQLGIVSV